MYAVIKTGGKQYRVAEGDVIQIEKLTGGVGENVTFEDVLLIGSDEETRVGTPRLEGASVGGTILNQGRHRKVIVFKFKRRKNYIRKNGHRQHFTQVRIDSIAG